MQRKLKLAEIEKIRGIAVYGANLVPHVKQSGRSDRPLVGSMSKSTSVGKMKLE